MRNRYVDYEHYLMLEDTEYNFSTNLEACFTIPKSLWEKKKRAKTKPEYSRTKVLNIVQHKGSCYLEISELEVLNQTSGKKMSNRSITRALRIVPL